MCLREKVSKQGATGGLQKTILILASVLSPDHKGRTKIHLEFWIMQENSTVYVQPDVYWSFTAWALTKELGDEMLH